MDNQQSEDPKAKLMNDARESYQRFEDIVTIREGDSALVKIGKVSLRILGITIMIILSPFLLIGLAIAFAAVF
ncbi:MAG: hypothetical protein WA004_04720 [Saprospiraceae bacterium]